MWATEYGRWMTAREMLLGMLFPVTNAALQAAQPRATTPVPLCSFNQSRVKLGLAPRDRTAMAHQTGNSVCVCRCDGQCLAVGLHTFGHHTMLDTTIAAGLSESWDFSWGITTCAFESEDALRLFFMPR